MRITDRLSTFLSVCQKPQNFRKATYLFHSVRKGRTQWEAESFSFSALFFFKKTRRWKKFSWPALRFSSAQWREGVNCLRQRSEIPLKRAQPSQCVMVSWSLLLLFEHPQWKLLLCCCLTDLISGQSLHNCLDWGNTL